MVTTDHEIRRLLTTPIRITDDQGDVVVAARLDGIDSSGPGRGFGDRWSVEPGPLLRQQGLGQFYVRGEEQARAWAEFIAGALEQIKMSTMSAAEDGGTL